MTSPFLDALGADGPSADRAGKMDLYGRFIGSWDLDVRQYSDDGRERRRAGEWHFGWALEGRAIQDVWIVPPRGELRHGDATAKINSYGTTLRIYDPRIDAWQIQWIDPARYRHPDGVAEELKGMVRLDEFGVLREHLAFRRLVHFLLEFGGARFSREREQLVHHLQGVQISLLVEARASERSCDAFADFHQNMHWICNQHGSDRGAENDDQFGGLHQNLHASVLH